MFFFSLAFGVSAGVDCSSLAAAKLAVASGVATGTATAGAAVGDAVGCCWALPEMSKSLALFCKPRMSRTKKRERVRAREGIKACWITV